MIFKEGRTSPRQIKGNPNKSESNKTGSDMFSRNTWRTRKSQDPAEYSSQRSASEQGAGRRLPLLFSVWSRGSRARQICKTPQKALKGPRTERPKPHIEILPHPGEWNLSSLRVSAASMGLKPCSLCNFCQPISPPGADLPQATLTSHKTAPGTLWTCHLPSSKFIFWTRMWVTSWSHPHPQTTVTTKCSAVKHHRYLGILLPPSHGDAAMHLAQHTEHFVEEARCNVTAKDSATRCKLFETICILDSFSRARYPPLPYSSWRHSLIWTAGPSKTLS